MSCKLTQVTKSTASPSSSNNKTESKGRSARIALLFLPKTPVKVLWFSIDNQNRQSSSYPTLHTVSSTVPSTHFTTAAGSIAQLRLRWLPSANLLDFFLDVLDRPDRQLRSFHRIEQILPPRINRDPAFGHDHIDQLSRPRQGRHFIHNHRNPIAETTARPESCIPRPGNSASRQFHAAAAHRSASPRSPLKFTSTSVAPSTTASTIDAKFPLP